MGLFGPLFGDNTTVTTVAQTFPVLAIATTEDLIRDRMIDVIESIVPAVLAGDRFRRHRNEDGDFVRWAEVNPAGALRRFQVRYTGKSDPPAVSNTDYAELERDFVITVAYPKNERAGRKNALDRDMAMSTDQYAIEHEVGLFGRANFSGSFPDATWRSGEATKVEGNAVDFLVIDQTMGFLRKV